MAQLFLGNWQFSFSFLVQSGLDNSPINILDFSGSGNGLTQRPELIAGDSAYCQPKGRNCWWNPKSFMTPPAYVFSPLKNNALFGPGAIIANTGLARLFPITERQTIEFRWEVFNLSNHANLYPPETGVILPNFGQPTAANTAGLGALNQTINDPRVMQFALKWSF
jgi:hypothetical protein